MRIRRATADDASEAAAMYTASRRAAAGYLPNTLHTEEEDRSFVREVLIATSDTWVADDDGRIVAILSLGDGWIDQLYVHPDFVGRGTGGELVRHAKRLHPSGLQLWTFQSNTGARRFYERHGFTAVERTDGASNEERAPDIRYLWAGDHPFE